jgi:hypothetical protein
MSQHPVQRSDRELLAALQDGAAREFEQTAEVLKLLAEVDERGAWAGKPYGSLFAYCTSELNWSEGEAFHKIRAARAGRKYPLLLARLGQGRLHLCGLVLLAPKLTPDNCHQLIDAACGLSKRKLEAMLAAKFPKPDVTAIIRKLPPAPTQNVAISTPRQEASATTAATPPSEESAPPRRPAQRPKEQAPRSVSPGSSFALEAPASTSQVEPLSAERHKLTVTVSGETRGRIERIQALLSHRDPDQRTLESVLDGALELLEAKLLKERFGIGAKPRTARRKKTPPARPDPTTVPGNSSAPRTQADDTDATATSATGPSSDPEGGPPSKPEPTWPRTFSRSDRRAIVARDGLRCAYVDPETGRRCEETRWLTFEHIEPWARGGPTTADNGQILCASHNRLRARQAYGDNFIDARISSR